MALASLSALLASLDSSVNIAFPAITAAFTLDVTLIQWVVVSYVLTYASLLLGCGRLADLWGHGRVLTWGLVASTLAFLACGLAPTCAWLLAARVLQGVAVALVCAAAGFALGPPLGGVLVDSFGWRVVYLFRVLPALLLTLVVAGQPRAAHEHHDEQPFDLLGALTLAGSVAGFLLAVSRGRDMGWTSPVVLVLLLVAGTCLAGFLGTETRVNAPLVDLS